MTRYTTLKLTLFAIALLVALMPGAAPANTPDGETPAVEEICADESGAAFGLCNAWCEAMDCHLAYDGNPDTSPKASLTACTRVEAKFMQITNRPFECAPGGSDPVCPTGTEGCPCGDGEYQCVGELYCDEDQQLCTADGGGEF